MLAGYADAVVYAAANLRPLEAVADMVSILRARKNVVSCSVVPLVYPDAPGLDRAAFTDPLRGAALDGGVSFFTTGIDSGFANDVLPLVLSGVSRVIDSVRVTEMFNYATYPDRAAVYGILGFGKPPEFPAFAAQPSIFSFGWGPVLHQLAAGLGVTIDSIEESNKRIPAAESFDTPTGHVAAGTIAAMRSTLTGLCRGQAGVRRRPRHPHARRHRTGLAPAADQHPAERPRVRPGDRARCPPRRNRWLTDHPLRVRDDLRTTTWVRVSPSRRGWSNRS